MPRYVLSKAADHDLTEIYRYSFTEFGERRADAYFESLEESLNHLSANPELGRDASILRLNYRLFVHKRHSIYYKSVRNGIFVVRVLGPGMSAEQNLL